MLIAPYRPSACRPSTRPSDVSITAGINDALYGPAKSRASRSPAAPVSSARPNILFDRRSTGHNNARRLGNCFGVRLYVVTSPAGLDSNSSPDKVLRRAGPTSRRAGRGRDRERRFERKKDAPVALIGGPRRLARLRLANLEWAGGRRPVDEDCPYRDEVWRSKLTLLSRRSESKSRTLRSTASRDHSDLSTGDRLVIPLIGVTRSQAAVLPTRFWGVGISC